jgi:hypothetical protein
MKGIWVLTALLLICAIASAVAFSYYYMEYNKYQRLFQDLQQKLGEVSISVNIAIDYGNGTRTWFNNTIVPIGATVFNATAKVADATPHPQYGESFIIAINGVQQKEDESMYWIWWIWDETQHAWVPGPVANNEYVLSNGQTVIWYYENASSWPPPTPP